MEFVSEGGVQTRLRHCWFLSVGQRASDGRVGEGQRAEGKGLRVARMPRGPRCKLQRAKKRAWAHGANPIRNHVAGPSGVHLQGLRFSALQFASITATAGRVLGRLTRRAYCLFCEYILQVSNFSAYLAQLQPKLSNTATHTWTFQRRRRGSSWR
jgi:hypothetical protein